MECEYVTDFDAKERVFVKRGRRCVADLSDGSYRSCFNYDKPDAVDTCSVRKELERKLT